MNVSHFCLTEGTYVEQTLPSCLIGVCLPNWTQVINLTKGPLLREKCIDVNQLGLPYACKTFDIFYIRVQNVTSPCDCIFFTKGFKRIKDISHFDCNIIVRVGQVISYVKLHSGWFLICGRMAYSYIPANSTGGPCTIGRFTVFMSQMSYINVTTPVIRGRHSLPPNCVSDLSLFSPAEYVSLSLFVLPAMSIALNVEISHLACSMAKAINATSKAISEINQELSEVRETVLEKRAITDYLLLRHNHGCEEFKGMCCFNLSDNSRLIEDYLKEMHVLSERITQRKGLFGLDLSAIPNWIRSRWSKFKEWIYLIIAFIATVLCTCCCIQLCPLCPQAWTLCYSHRRQP